MMNDVEEVKEYCENEDIKFIRLAFCDVYGRQKNISVMPSELKRAFEDGIAFDGSAVRGFGDITSSDLFLRPDPATLAVLPWRPEQQRVARMYCSVFTPDGGIHEGDTRSLLKRAVKAAGDKGVKILFGRGFELAMSNAENGGVIADRGGYMDMAPLDSCENFRRELCLTLEKMGIPTESSHHGMMNGQNRFAFAPADALKAADDTLTFLTAARAVAAGFGMTSEPVYSSFRISAATHDGHVTDENNSIGRRIAEITPFLSRESERCEIEYSGNGRLDLRGISVNPYLLFSLVIYAYIDDIESLPGTAGLIGRHLPRSVIRAYS